MNATRVLVAQHQAIGELFEELGHETRRPAKERLLSRIAEELIAHMAAEEAVFYPAARRVLNGEPGGAAQGREQHVTLRVELRRVLGASIGDASFDQHLTNLRSIFERHAHEEEQSLFPVVEQALSPGDLEMLGAEVLASRPPVWIVMPEGHALQHTRSALKLSSQVSLPIPPTRD